MNFIGEVINRIAVNKPIVSASGWFCPLRYMAKLLYFSCTLNNA
jgi:hypothetical protein